MTFFEIPDKLWEKNDLGNYVWKVLIYFFIFNGLSVHPFFVLLDFSVSE